MGRTQKNQVAGELRACVESVLIEWTFLRAYTSEEGSETHSSTICERRVVDGNRSCPPAHPCITIIDGKEEIPSTWACFIQRRSLRSTIPHTPGAAHTYWAITNEGEGSRGPLNGERERDRGICAEAKRNR